MNPVRQPTGQAERALLASIIDSSNNAILAMTLDGVITGWNRGADRIYGYTADEAVGTQVSVLIHGERPNEMNEILDSIRNGERVEHYETFRRRKDGRVIAVSLAVSPICDAGGEIIGASSISRDVTGRIRVEDQFRDLLESAPEAMVIAKSGGEIRLVNAQAEHLFGYNREELLGQPVEILVPERHRGRHQGHRDGFFSAPRVRPMGAGMELFGRRKNGTEFPVEVSLSPLMTDRGLLVSTAVRDITDRRAAEEKLRAASLYARSLIEASLDPLVMISADGKITDVNEGLIKATGVARERLIGTDFSDYFTEHEKAREGYRLAFSDGSITNYPLTIRRCDGGQVHVLYNASVYKNAHGDVLGVFAAARDVSAQKRAQEELVRAGQELRSSLREKEVLLQEVHHRVKNNLQVISSLINMQMRKMRDGASRGALEECQSRVEAIALIHEKLYQFKDYARVPFTEYATSLASNIFHAIGVSPGSVALVIEVDDILLAVDKAIPCGLILNELITNALRHAFPNERPGTLRVEFQRDGDRELVLSVSDDGVGMRPGFDPAKSDSLGLWLVTTLVEQLDGRLEIYQERGTMFRIQFPMETSA